MLFSTLCGCNVRHGARVLEGEVTTAWRQSHLTYGAFDTVKEELTTMMDLWASGDEETFEEYLRMDVETEGATAEEIALAEEFIKAMYTDRNQNMADFAEDALKSGDEVFICVGAAHVVGDDGMVGIMTERGYTVERVK